MRRLTKMYVVLCLACVSLGILGAGTGYMLGQIQRFQAAQDYDRDRAALDQMVKQIYEYRPLE